MSPASRVMRLGGVYTPNAGFCDISRVIFFDLFKFQGAWPRLVPKRMNPSCVQTFPPKYVVLPRP